MHFSLGFCISVPTSSWFHCVFVGIIYFTSLLLQLALKQCTGLILQLFPMQEALSFFYIFQEIPGKCMFLIACTQKAKPK